jgi:alpha/beta superfamily hydrolase
MPEKPVSFDSDGHRLEGLLSPGQETAVVITHPHPLYGGDMHNPVVEAIVAAYQSLACTTLRFNFRGVGRSGGRYGEGLTEQVDVCRAVTFLKTRGYRAIKLSGYSFGAWVNAHCAALHLPQTEMTMVAPPTAFMDFRPVAQIPGLSAVFTGSRDDIAPPQMLACMVPLWNPHARLEIVPGADHFFSTHIDALRETLERLLRAEISSMSQ